MEGLEGIIKSSIFIALFTIAMITFSINFAVDNDSDISLADDSRYSSLSNSLQNTDLEDLKSDAQVSTEILQKTSLSTGDQEIAGGGGQFKVGPYTSTKMAIRSFTTSFNTLFGPEFKFLLGAFVSLILFLVGFYIIKMWLGKDPK